MGEKPTLIKGKIMGDRFNPGRLGDWVMFCDICGQKCYSTESHKLSVHTGRGEAIVCKHDVDKIDYGLIPYVPRREKNVPWARIGDDNTDNASPLINPETMSYIYYLVTSQDNSILTSSQDNALITVNKPI